MMQKLAKERERKKKGHGVQVNYILFKDNSKIPFHLASLDVHVCDTLTKACSFALCCINT